MVLFTANLYFAVESSLLFSEIRDLRIVFIMVLFQPWVWLWSYRVAVERTVSQAKVQICSRVGIGIGFCLC